MPHVVHSFPDLAAASHAAADRIAHLLREMISTRDAAHLCLAGGNTPRGMYASLAAMPDIDWSHVHFWWGDERCVPPGDKDSNYRMAREALLYRLRVPDANIHRVPTELPPPQCAAGYEKELRGKCEPDPRTKIPMLDVLLMGIGPDGHTLSLFPGSPTLLEQTLLVAATHAPPTSPVRDRITLTLPTARAARYRIFLASGADKKAPISGCLATPPAPHPAGMVGESEWFLDAAATP